MDSMVTSFERSDQDLTIQISSSIFYLKKIKIHIEIRTIWFLLDGLDNHAIQILILEHTLLGIQYSL